MGRTAAEQAIRLVYVRLLEREGDPAGVAHHVNLLVNRNRSMREVVRGVGGSPEYFARFVTPHMPAQLWGTPITRYYRNFLDREPEGTGARVAHSKQYVRHHPSIFKAHRLLVDTFTSNEYLQKWGEQGVPGVGYNQPAPKQAIPTAVYRFCVQNKQGVPPWPNPHTVAIAASSWHEAETELRASLPNGGYGWFWTQGPC